MKIQCSCGAKFTFEVTPEMAQNPVRFVCPNCGLDSSEYVNQLVRGEIAENFPEAVPKPPSTAPATPRLRIAHEEKPAESQQEAAPAAKYCDRHRGVPVTEKCAVCGKPICPRCMEQFGYFCSPFCKNKADMQGLDVPVYAGQKFEVERQFWRKSGLIFGSIFAVVILFVGLWFWYAWFGSVPHKWLSVKFPDNDRAYAGGAQLVDKKQLVFLHGGTLARFDLKTKKPVWSQELISKTEIAAGVKAEMNAEAAAAAANRGGYSHRQSEVDIEREVRAELQRELTLYVNGQNIWVNRGGLLTRYDWNTGKAVQKFSLMSSGGTGKSAEAGGLPLNGSNNGQPLDPEKIAEQVQHLKLPARIALPALLANASYEQRLEAALNDNPKRPHSQGANKTPVNTADVRIVAGKTSFVQFSTRLIQERIVTREAMKAPPKKSALNGNLNASQTADVANEILNEMQRNRGGDKVSEDESLYQVTVHLFNAPDTTNWTGEVSGPPQLFVLKTVNVVAAGKTVIVLDKSNHKLWQTTLTYNMPEGDGGYFPGEQPQFGEGPCVEHGNTLYVFDKAVLNAFDLKTGNARWRVPSVGTAGLFFNDTGDVYVNTTTASPDDIKYSRQIDVTKSTQNVLMKINSQSGKILWKAQPGGFVSYLSGKYIYAYQSFDPNPDDQETINDMTTLQMTSAYIRIKRISPNDGRVLWTYEMDGCPVSVRFDQNTIELVFKREVEVLKYLTL